MKEINVEGLFEDIKGAGNMDALKGVYQGVDAYCNARETESIKLRAAFFMKAREIAERDSLKQTDVATALGINKSYINRVWKAQNEEHHDANTEEAVDYGEAVNRGIIDVQGRERGRERKSAETVEKRTPEEVFTAPEEMEDVKLRLPQIAELIWRLKEEDGVSFDRVPLTVGEARRMLLGRLKDA